MAPFSQMLEPPQIPGWFSCSGERSRYIAEAIRGWLPKVIQSVKPWMSDEDISAGSRWLTEVSNTLNTATIGLICVTPENQNSPWLLFEAGALSKTLEQTCVCPLVFEMTPGQLAGPLTQFQANALNREGIGKVVATINKSLGERQIEWRELEEIIDVWWPKLADRLQELPPVPAPAVTRSTNDQLEKLLALTREQMRRENLRLEAAKERDGKLEHMIELVERASAAASTADGRMKNLYGHLQASVKSLMAKEVDGIMANEVLVGELKNAGAALAAIAPPEFSPSDFSAMTSLVRDLHERDKERTQRMLEPESSKGTPTER